MKKYGLSADERIKRKKDFDVIFSSGTFIHSTGKKIKALYIVEKNNIEPGVKIAAVAGKRQGNAVWRNRIKRLIKESYRQNKEILSGISTEKKILLKIIFSPFSLNQKNNKVLSLEDIWSDMLDVMTKIKSKLR